MREYSRENRSFIEIGGKNRMAKNEPNKPEDGKTMPANETPKEQTAPVSEPLAADKQSKAPEVAADKAATRPGPGDDVVVSFDKINEINIGEKGGESAGGRTARAG